MSESEKASKGRWNSSRRAKAAMQELRMQKLKWGEEHLENE